MFILKLYQKRGEMGFFISSFLALLVLTETTEFSLLKMFFEK